MRRFDRGRIRLVRGRIDSGPERARALWYRDPGKIKSMSAVLEMTQSDWVDPVARAREIVPVLLAEGAAIDAAGRLTPPVVEALHASGLYRTLLPRSLKRRRNSTWY